MENSGIDKISLMFLTDINAFNVSAAAMLFLVLYFMFFIWQQSTVKRTWSRFSSLNFLIITFLSIILTALFLVSTIHVGIGGAALAITMGVGISLSFVHPVIAVSFFLSNLLIRPWEFIALADESLMKALPKGLAVMCILSWLLHCFRKRHFYFIWNNTWSLFVLFIIWLFIAGVFGGDGSSVGDGGSGPAFIFQNFFPIVVIFFLIFNSAHSEDEVRLIEVSLLITVVGLMAASEIFMSNNTIADRLAGGIYFGNANDLAALVLIVFPFLFLPLRKHKLFTWLLIIFATVILLIAIQWADSRAAKLSLIATVGLYCLLHFKLSLKKLILGGILAAIVLPFMMHTSRDESDLEMSSSSRLNYAITGFKMLKSNPLFGVGLNNYPKYYERYTSNFDEYGERTAHSSWILVMSEAGFPALMLFAMLFYSAFKRAWRIRRKHPEFFLCIFGYGLVMTVLSHTYSMSPYIVLALVLVGYRVYYDESEEPKRKRNRRNYA